VRKGNLYIYYSIINITMENKTEQTTIQIKKETWVRLNSRKSYPSQTFDTIINNLIDYEKAQMFYDLKPKKELNGEQSPDALNLK